MKKQILKSSLLASSALAVVLAIAPMGNIANAQTYNMTTDETLTVANGAPLQSADTPVVQADGVTGVGIIVEENASIEYTTTPGTGYAISIVNSTDMSGGIINHGQIIGGNTVGGAAIYLNDATISGDIINSSTGEIVADDAFFLENGAVISGNITNHGLILGHDADYFLPMCEAFQLTDAGTEISGTITNYGTIQADLAVFDISNGAIISGDIINEEGAIIESTRNGWFDGGAIHVYSGSDISGNIINKGTITNSGGQANIYVTDSSISGGITNEATGIIDGSNVSYAIYLESLTQATPININGGQIIGNIYDTSYNSGNDYSPVTIGGVFTQEGNFQVSSFTVNKNGDFTFDNNYTFTTHSDIINNGIMRIDNDFNFSKNIVNNGNIHIGPDVSLTLDNENIITGSGTFNIGILHGEGVRVGSINFSFGGKREVGEEECPPEGCEAPVGPITMDLRYDSFHFIVADGSTLIIGENYTIVNTNGTGLLNTGVATPRVTDNSSAYKFVLSYDENDNLIVTVQESNGIEASAGNADTQRVADVLQEIIDSGNPIDPKLDSILNAAMDANNSDELDSVLKKLRRPVDGSTHAGGLAVARGSSNMAMARLGALRSGDRIASASDSFSLDGESGMAAGNPYFFTQTEHGKHAWVQPFGQIGRQGTRQGFEGYNADTYGMMFGIDSNELVKDATLGAAFSYGRTDVDSKSANNTQIKTNTYQISVYGEKALTEDVRIDAVVGYAFSRSDMTIYNIGGNPALSANAKFNGQQFSAQTGLNKSFKLENGFTVTPSVSANYIYADVDQYTDSGAGGASATVDTKAMELFELGLGIEASKVYQISPCDCGTDWLKPIARLGVRHDLVGDKLESTTQFVGGGSSFKTYGFTPAKTTYNLGLGFKRYSLEDWEVTAMYDLELKSDYHAHNASVRFGKRF